MDHAKAKGFMYSWLDPLFLGKKKFGKLFNGEFVKDKFIL